MTSIPFLLCCVIFTWPSVRRNISFIGSPTQKIVSREAKFFGQAADRICLQAGTGRPANSSGAFIKRLPWGPKKRFEWSHSGTALLTALIRLRQSMKYMLCDAGKHRARKIGLPSREAGKGECRQKIGKRDFARRSRVMVWRQFHFAMVPLVAHGHETRR